MEWNDEEGVSTLTSFEQGCCEKLCFPLLSQMFCLDEFGLSNFRAIGILNADNEIRLLRSKHIEYLINNLDELPQGFVSLDSSRPWIIYWILHSLYLLGRDLSNHHDRIVLTLKAIQNATGGFGGGPMQISQGAPNYAAVLSLCTIGSQEALSIINRKAMYQWFLKLKQPSGGFSIHVDGETDTRSTYTVISISRLLNILSNELADGCANYVLSCQTYEGGFGGEAGNEAHGGYNFCAMATLLILGASKKCNLVLLEKWLLNRQVKIEGGFQGRTNKLVDSCYSFWLGAASAILQVMKVDGDDLFDARQYLAGLEKRHSSTTLVDDADLEFGNEGINVVSDYSGCLPFNQVALQRYVLHCSQNFDSGGLRDKPGKPRDFYHCCYSLSGLSISQRSIVCDVGIEPKEDHRNEANEELDDIFPVAESFWSGPQVYGDVGNLLEPTSIVYNIGITNLIAALNYFTCLPNQHHELC